MPQASRYIGARGGQDLRSLLGTGSAQYEPGGEGKPRFLEQGREHAAHDDRHDQVSGCGT
jgi:hypothetical protein